MQVELLYFDDCPSWRTALEHLQAVMADLGQGSEVRLTRVETEVEAIEARFVGSPTIRLDGEDLFPSGSEDFALGCRVYSTPEGLRGWPTREMLYDALKGSKE
jgi:hypothetical protein